MINVAGISTFEVPGDLYDLINFGPNRIYIYDNEGTFVVSALIVGDVDLKGNASWDSSFSGGTAVTEMFNAGIGAGSHIMNTMGALGTGSYVTKPHLRTPEQSVVDWRASGEFSLNLQLMFISLTPKEDIRIPIYNLMKCVYPIVIAGGMFVIPPLYYAKRPMNSMGEEYGGVNRGTQGCVGIKIGDWFEAPPVFVVDSVSINMSKEQTPAGLPLYGNGMVSVKCCHQVGTYQLKEWLGLPEEFD